MKGKKMRSNPNGVYIILVRRVSLNEVQQVYQPISTLSLLVRNACCLTSTWSLPTTSGMALSSALHLQGIIPLLTRNLARTVYLILLKKICGGISSGFLKAGLSSFCPFPMFSIFCLGNSRIWSFVSGSLKTVVHLRSSPGTTYNKCIIFHSLPHRSNASHSRDLSSST